MTHRIVTAVVLLSPRDTPTHHRETFAALQAQTRPPDRVVVVAPSDLPDGTEAVVDEAFDAGGIDELLRTSAAVGHVGAVRHVLDLLADPDRLPPVRRPVEQEAPTSGSGRRALDIDVDEAVRRELKEADTIAQVPVRLRERTGAPGRRGAGRRRALDGDSWLWFVPEDSAPGRRALEELLEVVGRSPSTAVAGPKRVRHRDAVPLSEHLLSADDADGLVDVGLTLTHGGRIHTGVEPGEIDQGQLDWREDVLAVALPGMLVRESTLVDVGGFDAALPAPWAEIDLCHRVWRGGERVAVVAAARAVSPAPPGDEAARLREHRRGQLLTLLKHRPLPYAVLFLLLTPLMTLARMLGAIVVHRPRLAGAEVMAWIAMLRGTPRALAQSAVISRRSPVPRRRLAPLYLPRGEDLRQQIDTVWTRLFADDDRTRRIRRTTWGISGTTHGADDADFGRHGVWTLVLALGATCISLIALRSLFGRGDLAGPSFLPLPEDWRETAQAAWSSWIPGDLGARGPADPLIRLLGSVPVPGGLLVEAIVFTAVPVSALAAWWAAGALTRAIGARLAIAVVWASAPTVLSALASGAWQALLVHMLLPLLALAVGRAIGLPHRVSQASVSAAAAGGLVLLVIGAAQPVLVLVTALALALLAPSVPGRRSRLIWVLVPSIALHLPYIAQYVHHPATLLAGIPGTPAGQQSGITVISLWPVVTPAWQLLAPVLGGTTAAMLPVLLLAPVVLAACAAPFLEGDAARAGRLALLVAAVALALAVLAARTPIAVEDGALLSASQHGLVSIALLAVLLGAGCTFDALARRGPTISRPRRVLSLGAAWVMAAVCTALVVGWSMGLPAVLGLHRDTTVEVPAAAADSGRSGDRQRVLVLRAAGPDQVRAQLVVGGGDSAIEHSGFAEARIIDAVAEDGSVGTDPGTTALRESAAQLLSSSPPDAASVDAMRLLGIEYIVVPGSLGEQEALASALDSSPRLEKVTQTTTGGLWRLVDSAPRAWAGRTGQQAGASETVPIGSQVITAEGTVDAADEERVLVLSERFDAEWTATVGGTELEAVRLDDWAQGFVLPAGTGGEVRIEREQPFRLPAQILLGATVVLTALTAVPWRRRGVRTEVPS
ncbi:hypothetical protein [Brachybacterium phenoliresistens]|uniref:hypothetical protein n=1 Tax=Brachybacterium phenoliresistens TaxID=396014 RepID=UPI0031D28016